MTAQPIYTNKKLIFDEKKKEYFQIIRPSLHFYGIVLEKPSAKEWMAWLPFQKEINNL